MLEDEAVGWGWRRDRRNELAEPRAYLDLAVLGDDRSADKRIDRNSEEGHPRVRRISCLARDVVFSNRDGSAHVDDGHVSVSAGSQRSFPGVQAESPGRI